MVGPNLKAESIALMEKREAVEGEMNAIIHRLSQPDGPGLSGNLLDSEGFPRADIDIPAVRAERRRLAELKNDYENITEQITQKIELLHETKLTSKPGHRTVAGSDALRQMDISSDADLVTSIPFAMVDEIADASPAAEDGLQLGDQIAKFGGVQSGDNFLSRLANEVQMNQGSAMPVVVLRQGAAINLSVTPRTWSGRGLLGCHFRIL